LCLASAAKILLLSHSSPYNDNKWSFKSRSSRERESEREGICCSINSLYTVTLLLLDYYLLGLQYGITVIISTVQVHFHLDSPSPFPCVAINTLLTARQSAARVMRNKPNVRSYVLIHSYRVLRVRHCELVVLPSHTLYTSLPEYTTFPFDRFTIQFQSLYKLYILFST
jgi:hypothetical protein